MCLVILFRAAYSVRTEHRPVIRVEHSVGSLEKAQVLVKQQSAHKQSTTVRRDIGPVSKSKDRAKLSSRQHPKTTVSILSKDERMLRARGFRLVRKIRGATLTAYAVGDGHTPGNKPTYGGVAQRGVVAFDPRFLKPRTQLYIPGYGFGKALDTGGDIKGSCCFDVCYGRNVRGAKNWGRKTKDVWVLAPI